MVQAEFFLESNNVIGFCVKGHAGAGEFGEDIVCAGVSSAVMLTTNTISEFIKAKADINVDSSDENAITLKLIKPYNEQAIIMLNSFKFHIEALKEDYGHIAIRIKG